MAKMHIMKVFAGNLEAAMRRKGLVRANGKVNQSEMARISEVAQKGISNYLTALEKNDNADLDAIQSPSLSVIEKLASSLDMSPWELIHPDPELAKRQQELYERVEKEFIVRGAAELAPSKNPAAKSKAKALITQLTAQGAKGIAPETVKEILESYENFSLGERQALLGSISAIAGVDRRRGLAVNKPKTKDITR